jgi:hypothetical protein
VAWFLNHTIDPRTGRPLPPPYTWLALRLEAFICWGMAIFIVMIAGMDFAMHGARDAQPMWLTGAAIFGALGYVPHAILGNRKRRYREALTAYEIALASATLPG